MKLEDIIADNIPASMLERVVFDQNVMTKGQREGVFKSGLPAIEIARRVIQAYGAQASVLAYGLYEQIRFWDWENAGLLYEHFKSAGTEYYNQQASLVGRIPNVPIDALNDFLTSIKSQVCLIVSRHGAEGKVVRGTGFLVGPDLVVTCWHVLKAFADDTDLTRNGNQIEIYFDFFRGEAVESLNPDLPQTRKVGLAAEWRVAGCQDTVPDGILDDLTDADVERIGRAFDFVLLRLAEPVGQQAVGRSGGRRRLWVDLSAAVPPKAAEDWIIIPQHPNGSPQRIDLGRFRTMDPTETRLRYNTNTAPGSSGAPCFNQDFRLVGVHNASVGPAIKPVANQAIRATCIAERVKEYLDRTTQAEPYVTPWSVSGDNEPPMVILGREKLLTWLHASATTKPKTLADRVYVADAVVPAAGCSFSLNILHTQIRDTKTPRAVYGQRGQQLPATAEDFLLSLVRELGIKLGPGDSIPTRPAAPGARGSLGSSEADKLGLWISNDLPEWLGGVINRYVEKEVDAVPDAREGVRILKAQGLAVPKDLKERAESPVPIMVRIADAWDFAYVVLDDLRASNYSGTGPRTEFQGEVRDLIAALVRGKIETSIHSGLRRLRWMFLGYLPDFLPEAGGDGNGATREVLNPATIGVDQILSIFERMSQAHVQMQAGADLWWPEMAEMMLETAATSTDPWLVSLQRVASRRAAKLLKRLGV